jgi:hypothetical protein
MNVVAISACFLAALLTTLARGAGSAFALVYLPALLLLSGVTGQYIPLLPDATPPTASVYGILLGGLLGGRWPRFRPTVVDGLFVTLLVAYVVSALTTEDLWAGVSIFGSSTLQLVAPYFIARSTLRSRTVQLEALAALVGSILFIACFGLIEMRLWPQTYAQILAALGLSETPSPWMAQRFGLFRARSSLLHPIDLGNSGALVFAAIFMLAHRSGIGVGNVWVRLGLVGALVASFSGLSFSSFFGLGAGVCLYLAIATFPFARRLLAPVVVVLIAVGFLYAAHIANEPLPERPIGESQIAGSYWIRQLILHQAWEHAASAGPFGRGMLLDVGELDLESIDNSYLLLAMQRGWVSLGLWLALPVCLGALASRAARHSRSGESMRAILCGFCATIGTMVAMFTVFFGFVYASLFVTIVGLTVGAAQAALVTASRVRTSSRAQRIAPAGAWK